MSQTGYYVPARMRDIGCTNSWRPCQVNGDGTVTVRGRRVLVPDRYVVVGTIPSKTCSMCGETKAVNRFNRNSSREDRLHAICASCQTMRLRA